MPRKMAKTVKRRRHRGGGYGFGGSILDNVAGAGAGNVDWKSTGGECGSAGRGGNNTLAGGRRRRRTLRGGSSCSGGDAQEVMGGRRRRRNSKRGGKRGRRTMKGGMLALQQPRTGYTFTGAGAGGIADAVPVPPYTTYV